MKNSISTPEFTSTNLNNLNATFTVTIGNLVTTVELEYNKWREKIDCLVPNELDVFFKAGIIDEDFTTPREEFAAMVEQRIVLQAEAEKVKRGEA